VEVLFAEPALEALATEGDGRAVYGARVIACLRLRIQALMAAPTENALFGLRALDLQSGDGGNEYSMRVDDEFRLRLSFEDRDHVRHAIIHAIARQNQPGARISA
jgi:plasmid maintenance system killer protein